MLKLDIYNIPVIPVQSLHKNWQSDRSNQMTQDTITPTERTRVKRGHKRANYDRETIYSILDATPLCHIGFLRDQRPSIIPTLQWRHGDYVYWHGSSASAAILSSANADVCLTVTLLDGMVMARSAFHHSVNYRSVVLYGKPEQITDPDLKAEKLKEMIDVIYPGRWEHLRPMLDKEVKATGILSMKIDEASAKIRTGMPEDDEEDYALPIWAGVIPIATQQLEVLSDPKNLEGVQVPEHLKNFKIG